MSEIDINYKGSKIAGMDASGTKTLLTEGKYCDDDIEIVYTRPGDFLYESKSCQLSSAGQTLTFTGLTANPHHFFVRHTGQLSLSKPSSGSYYYTTGCGKIVSTSTMLYTNYAVVGSSSAVKHNTNTSYPNFTWNADTNTLSVKTVANRTTAPGYFVVGTWVLHSFYEPTT